MNSPPASSTCSRSSRRAFDAGNSSSHALSHSGVPGCEAALGELAGRQDDLMRHAESAGIPRDTPWYKLTAEQKGWVINGTPGYKEGNWNKQWYGIKRFFEYLESKAYKMHIRVLLSKYRSYTPCEVCAGARLKTDSLLWRIGSKEDADAVMQPSRRFMPAGVDWTREQLEALPGLCLHDLMLMPIDRLRKFFDRVEPETEAHAGQGDLQALKLLFEEITTRLKYLVDVGIGYLTLDRQSRTLSGGEVQRINLTTALGTSLVNTLFVLDEPSIGLHPRDMNRITEAMKRLRDAGNTLVVVEHDPAVMLAADRIIDMGPGPGERGGQIVFDGTTQNLRNADTLTGAYLGARKHVGMGFKRAVTDATPRLILEGARQHNLKKLAVEFPLQRLVCVTGVSGSGKSSLIQDVLAPALARHFGKATETPGLHDRLLGADHLSDVVFVDQSPIGKTARSNPVSYVGAWDAIREIFANSGLARQRGYTGSKFSFNSGDGRCPTCGGSGFEHVEMQFLSDVYLRCPDCDGKRYRPEILEVTIERQPIGALRPRMLNVADVLDLTVSEAASLFANDRDVIRALQPIVDVGLEYVKLGQPVPTLSGGESQRLKLAGFLAQAARSATSSRQATATRGVLFLFDEPTTGLHFDDIAKLMRALRKLLEGGSSIVIIEHNLDVIRAADWLIDLGPEGGDAGGWLVAEGPPEDVKLHPSSHTAKALREYDSTLGVGSYVVRRPSSGGGARPDAAKRPTLNAIQIVNAREHNLKSLSVDIPHNKFSVVTGVSGSGKSTLAFDILFNEGQRRYLESLNAYARSIVQPAGRPEVDAVYGIPPTVAIEQRLSRGGRKSTVGTTTEVWHFLRLLYVKLGVQHCVQRGRRGAAANTGQHRRAIDEALQGTAHRPAGAAGGESQGRLHRAGRLGAAARLHASAGGRQFPAHHRLSPHRPLQGAHDRIAGVRPGRDAGQREPAARKARAGAGARQGRAARAGAAGWPQGRDDVRPGLAPPHRQDRGVLHPARLPGLQHQLCRTGPAPVLLQQQARLVPRLRGHGRQAHARAAQGLRRHDARRRQQGPRADLRRAGGRRRGR